ncbi:MAG: hypothetical protein U0M54_03470 [Bacteroidales bacterium]|nr:hypothetical protein [Bacteroides sp.]
MMNKKFDGAAAPKHYESPSLEVLNVNLEMGFAQSGGNIGDLNAQPASLFDAYGYYDELD